MTVGYFCLQSTWTLHFVHDLELIEADLAVGHDVHVVHPEPSMRFSDTAPWADFRGICPTELRCLTEGLSLLSGKVTLHSIDRLADQGASRTELERVALPALTHHSLNGFCFQAHDCGNATRSSLISYTRHTAVNVARYGRWIARAMETSIKVYLAAKAFIQCYRPVRVYVFNARMATFRGVLRACQEAGVKCIVHERGATLDRIGLSVNAMPHDIYWTQSEILRQWKDDDAAEEQKREIGKSFYQKKRDKHVFDCIPYTQHQERNRLPARLERYKRIYSIFTSGEFERFALPQYYQYLLHQSQVEGILDVARMLRENGFDGALCIRIHPNSHNERPNLYQALRRQLNDDFVHVIPATSVVDTYALIDASEKVITFGSTVAMEAAYWGKPSVSFATNPYQHLDAIYQPTNRQDALRLLLDDLQAKGQMDCIKYGYYYSVFGRPLRYSQVAGVNALAFKGRVIAPGFWYSRVRRNWHKLRNCLRAA